MLFRKDWVKEFQQWTAELKQKRDAVQNLEDKRLQGKTPEEWIKAVIKAVNQVNEQINLGKAKASAKLIIFDPDPIKLQASAIQELVTHTEKLLKRKELAQELSKLVNIAKLTRRAENLKQWMKTFQEFAEQYKKLCRANSPVKDTLKHEHFLLVRWEPYVRKIMSSIDQTIEQIEITKGMPQKLPVQRTGWRKSLVIAQKSMAAAALVTLIGTMSGTMPVYAQDVKPPTEIKAPGGTGEEEEKKTVEDYVKEANTFYEKDQYQNAAVAYQNAIHLDSEAERKFLTGNDLINNYFKLGFSLAEQGKYDEALKAYTKVAELKPKIITQRNYLNSKAKAAHDKAARLAFKNDFKGALKQLELCDSLEPNNVATVYTRAWVISKQGNPEGSIAKFKIALKTNPLYVNCYGAIGLNATATKNYREAIFYDSISILLDPTDTSEIKARISKNKELDETDKE